MLRHGIVSITRPKRCFDPLLSWLIFCFVSVLDEDEVCASWGSRGRTPPASSVRLRFRILASSFRFLRAAAASDVSLMLPSRTLLFYPRRWCNRVERLLRESRILSVSYKNAGWLLYFVGFISGRRGDAVALLVFKFSGHKTRVCAAYERRQSSSAQYLLQQSRSDSNVQHFFAERRQRIGKSDNYQIRRKTVQL